MNYIVDQICEKLIATVKKKTGKGGFNIKPFQVKSHLWVFVNTLIENPTFDSQTKENMTLRKSAFGSTCELSEKYIKMVLIIALNPFSIYFFLFFCVCFINELKLFF